MARVNRRPLTSASNGGGFDGQFSGLTQSDLGKICSMAQSRKFPCGKGYCWYSNGTPCRRCGGSGGIYGQNRQVKWGCGPFGCAKGYTCYKNPDGSNSHCGRPTAEPLRFAGRGRASFRPSGFQTRRDECDNSGGGCGTGCPEGSCCYRSGAGGNKCRDTGGSSPYMTVQSFDRFTGYIPESQTFLMND